MGAHRQTVLDFVIKIKLFWWLNVRNIPHGVLEKKMKTSGFLDNRLMLVSLTISDNLSDHHSCRLTYVGTSLHLLPPIGKPVVHFECSDSFKFWKFASWNNIYIRHYSFESINMWRHLYIQWGRGTFATKMATLQLVWVWGSSDTDCNHLPGFWMTALQALAISSLLASSGYWFSIKKLRTNRANQNKTWDIMIIVQPIENRKGLRTLCNTAD